jgi:DNA mismatch endonuclease (patch repair protein)
MMSRIRSTNTRIELEIRKRLWARGVRYRLGGFGLPGKPDLVLPHERAVVFVHGCFWHGHHCSLFRLPRTRTHFWKEKIAGNRDNDRRVQKKLSSLAWRSAIIWECALRGKSCAEVDRVVETLMQWLSGVQEQIDIS